jgi:streptomycin 6-kinase
LVAAETRWGRRPSPGMIPPMGERRVAVPDLVRERVAAEGGSAAGWLADLPALVASIERDWDVVAGPPFGESTEAYVCAATRADGTPAVLKLTIPRPGDAFATEATALRLADGRGCARLLCDDPDRQALLLERLGRTLHDVGLPLGRRHDVLCAAARRVWRPVPPGSGLPTGAAKARRLATSVVARWEELGRPCSERAVADAVAAAASRERAHDDERAVLVHGDVHEWNALESGDGFTLVDPDGLVAEPELDLGVMLREDPVELVAGDPWDRAHALVARCGGGLDPTAVWEWGVVERVSTGLLATQIGLQPFGRQTLAAADRIAADGAGRA